MPEDFAPTTDDLVEANRRYVAAGHRAGLSSRPSRGMAVVVCMDCRIDVSAALGVDVGEVHVLRNAGGVVTDDVIRSLCLSQRALGTREIVLVHHTGCGVQGLDGEALSAELESEVGVRPPWRFHGFQDPAEDVRASMRRLIEDPFVSHTEHLRGFVLDVDSGTLREVAPQD